MLLRSFSYGNTPIGIITLCVFSQSSFVYPQWEGEEIQGQSSHRRAVTTHGPKRFAAYFPDPVHGDPDPPDPPHPVIRQFRWLLVAPQPSDAL